ncbi:symbiosis-like protein [Mycena rebaudengoi]|nr:symbiosis-like protein [Mycena rebaudengoi]
MPPTFKSDHTLDRQAQAQRMLQNYPDMVPVICERAASSSLPEHSKKKYLIPSAFTIIEFTYVMRNNLKIASETALFIFVGNGLAQSSTTLLEVYQKYKEDDGFLYLTYSS